MTDALAARQRTKREGQTDIRKLVVTLSVHGTAGLPAIRLSVDVVD